ncbi:hypothetical protein CIL03_05460 [Virgibacillus indicus]|uniref:Transposase putative helix-turn-helix domain-containing protein n=1 Tax=Virgibacillus indicus TaxID=2024554 RepID=A0A265NEX6_9BACI|nr:hypothetical protein CIL03_05460 [Virgibacillus indicus]
MLLNQKYEIFPSNEQRETLDTWLSYCRQAYNSALLDKQRKYEETKESYSRFAMQTQLKRDKLSWTYLKEMPPSHCRKFSVVLTMHLLNSSEKKHATRS